MARPLYIAFGWLCVGLGMTGIIMPILPTTPFLLLAVWAFSRSSPELAERIRSNRYAGAYIRDWQDNGVIPPKAKALALAMMTAMVIYVAVWTDAPGWAVMAVAAVMLAVAAYIVTRPGYPPE